MLQEPKLYLYMQTISKQMLLFMVVQFIVMDVAGLKSNKTLSNHQLH
jgi:hypothetical protein